MEFVLWGHYRARFGFEVDRIEGATASGASAVCHAWGAKITPQEILPKFGSRAPSKRKMLLQLASLPGATVEFVPNGGGPAVVGAAALAKLDEDDDGGTAGRRTLDGPVPPRKPRRGGTLSGD